MDMSLDELWELFPITLVESDPRWKTQYQHMEKRIRNALAAFDDVRINHIGSTAIAGILSKDTVDVLVEIDPTDDLEQAASTLEDDGFLRMASSASPYGKRISLNHGYTPQGYADEVYHIHMRYRGDDDEVYFRDYLNAHPEVAEAYEKLKIALLEEHGRDRDAYTEGKTDFVRRWTEVAKCQA